MFKHTESRVFNYHPKDLYNIVADIESYPEFLPWCEAARVLWRRANKLQAQLIIGYKGINSRYTSEVTLIEPKTRNSDCAIQVHLIDGPFKSLDNHWDFHWDKHKRQTIVNFSIEFEMKSSFFNKVVGLVFEKILVSMVDAFENRAKDLLTEV